MSSQQIEDMRHDFLTGAFPSSKSINELCDLALRALPLPEGALYRCKACGCVWRKWPGDGGWSLADAAQRACARCDNSPEFLSLIEPVGLPEGEVKELVRELNIAAGFYADEAGTDKVLRKAAAAVERQAASLAASEARADLCAAGVEEAQAAIFEARSRAEAAEASLASARERFSHYARHQDHCVSALNQSCDCGLESAIDELRTRALSSPRQEDTQT